MNNKRRKEILKEINILLELGELGLEYGLEAAGQTLSNAGEAATQAATKSPLTLGDVGRGLRSFGAGTTQRAKAAFDFLKSRPQALRSLMQAANAARAASPAVGASTTVASFLGYAAAGAVIGAALGYAINKSISSDFGDELKEIIEKARSDNNYLITELNSYLKGGYSYGADESILGYSLGGRGKQTPNSYNTKDAVIIAALFQIIYDREIKSGLISETKEIRNGQEINIVNIKKSSLLLNYKNLFDKVFIQSQGFMRQKLTESGLINFVDTLELAYTVSALPASAPIAGAQAELKVGDKVKYKPNPNMGVYTVSAIDKQGKISIKTSTGKDAGTGENPGDYEIMKESLRKNIIKEINKLLNEAPIESSEIGTKGTKDNPFNLAEFQAFENSGLAARAKTSQALGKESMGAAPLPQGFGQAYYVDNAGTLKLAQYDSIGNYRQTQQYSPDKQILTIVHTRTDPLESPEPSSTPKDQTVPASEAYEKSFVCNPSTKQNPAGLVVQLQRKLGIFADGLYGFKTFKKENPNGTKEQFEALLKNAAEQGKICARIKVDAEAQKQDSKPQKRPMKRAQTPQATPASPESSKQAETKPPFDKNILYFREIPQYYYNLIRDKLIKLYPNLKGELLEDTPLSFNRTNGVWSAKWPGGAAVDKPLQIPAEFNVGLERLVNSAEATRGTGEKTFQTESWSIRNKNKYAENLLERLIKDITNRGNG